MGTVFIEKSGKYAGRRYRGVVELPKDPKGGRHKHVFYGDVNMSLAQQKREVQSQVNQLEYEIANNLYMKESNSTVEEYFNTWLPIYTGDLEETTKELYEMYVKVHINPAIGGLKIKDIKPMQIQEFYNSLAEDKEIKKGKKATKKKGLSKNTIGKIHSFLNTAFEDAIKNRLIKYNPCTGVKKPKKTQYKPKVCTEENFNHLLDETMGTFDSIMIMLAGICGLRRGEIFGLRLIDIDFKNSKISIFQTKVRFNGKWIIKKPKSDSSIRTISVPQFVVDAINDYVSKLKVVPKEIFSEYMPGAYSEHFGELLIKHNLPHIRFHDLRHYNAVIMLKYGISDKVASERLGHSDPTITRKIYQHVLTDMDKHASNVIESIFINKEENQKKPKGS